jgi:hypothetical protein
VVGFAPARCRITALLPSHETSTITPKFGLLARIRAVPRFGSKSADSIDGEVLNAVLIGRRPSRVQALMMLRAEPADVRRFMPEPSGRTT